MYLSQLNQPTAVDLIGAWRQQILLKIQMDRRMAAVCCVPLQDREEERVYPDCCRVYSPDSESAHSETQRFQSFNGFIGKVPAATYHIQVLLCKERLFVVLPLLKPTERLTASSVLRLLIDRNNEELEFVGSPLFHSALLAAPIWDKYRGFG
ncbi:hypothetical protein BDP27DRAFT_1368175 [Rhodocollybia butyracea]|uniref:Uncharacterized protein n=1 Tax=Rhodocollybia butyracea TaxID=206335 RepID=A0A9P5PHF1_9AGAR|nr:hypothetical protein BDP27DRAFT_1368175 [Rhodocollybia butyracea]